MGYDGSLKFDTKVDQTGFSGGIAQLKSNALAAISVIGSAFATGAIAQAIVGQIKLVEQYGSAINDQSQKISISAKAYQELSYVFGQTGGNADVLQMGIKTLSNAVVDGSKAFDAIGVSIEKARAMSQEDLFNLVLEQLAEMPPSAKRTAAAVDLLGRSATELNPLFNMGAAGIAKMRQEANNYSLILSDKAIAQTDAYGDATSLAQQATEALRNAVVGKAIPTLTTYAKEFANVAKESTNAFNARGVSGVVDVITDRFPVATAAVSGLGSAFAALLIIETVQKGMASFAATEALLTAATEYGTMAQWADLGALTAKQAVVGLLTGKIKTAAEAQAVFNAVIEANPVMILVTSIGLLVGGVILLSKNFDKLYPSISETREELDALDKTMEDSVKTFDETLNSIEKQRFGLDETVDILKELSAAYTGSSAEQRKMQSLCDSLNAEVDGLNISFDEQTGKLSQNVGAIKDQIESQYDLARATAASARYQELVTAQLDAQYAKRQAQIEFEKYHAADGTRLPNLDFGSGFYAAGQTELNLQRATTSANEASIAVQSFDSFIKESSIGLKQYSDFAGEVDESLNILGFRLNDTAEVQERVVLGGYDVTDVLTSIGMSADDASDRLGGFTSMATNMFEKIKTKSKDTAKTATETLEWNLNATKQFGQDIVSLSGKLPQEMLDALNKNPEQNAGFVKNLAKSSDEELAKLSETYASAGDAAKQAWLDSLGAGTEIADSNPAKLTADAVTADTTLQPAVVQSVADAKTAMTKAVSDQNFGAIGKNITSGVAVGMLSRKKEIIAAAVILATAANTAFNNALEVNSPSKVTMRTGVSFVKGFVMGIMGKVNDARVAVRSLSAASALDLRSSITVPSGTSAFSTGSAAATYVTNSQAGNANYGIQGGVHIGIAGKVESDVQLARRVTREIQEVAIYGRGR